MRSDRAAWSWHAANRWPAERPSFPPFDRDAACSSLTDSTSGERTSKQSFPYFIHRPGNAPFAMAAIWEPALPAPGKSELDSCAIITRPARPPVSEIHDRMPVMLAPEHHDAWLDPAFSDVAVLRSDVARGSEDRIW